MEGFYSKRQVATILGVSIRQITTYLKEGKLRRVYSGQKVWVPHEDVHRLYEDGKQGLVPTRQELHGVEDRVARLEETIEVLKLGMGFGSARPPLGEKDLLLLRQSFIDDLSRPSWPTRRVSEIADTLASLQEEDLHALCRLKGITAWMPLFELLDRVTYFIEQKEEFPECGLGTLHSRLLKAKDRLLGLIYVSSKIDTKLPQNTATDLRKQLRVVPGEIDTFIGSYIVAREAK
jgi:hypothetical protein